MRVRRRSVGPAKPYQQAVAGIEGLFAELAQNPEEIIAIGEKYGCMEG